MFDQGKETGIDQLSFDLELGLPGFQLNMAACLPLHGITAITGPSGSGKTTLLRILAGLQRADRGVVRLGGQIWQDNTTFVPPEKRGVGYVFQEPRLFPHLSIAENLAFGARRRGVPQARLDEIVDLLDLGGLMGRPARALSGGEARRVALGRALASGPSILFLDEPMTGLDLQRKAEILPHIARAALALGLPALFVTHTRDEVLRVADRCLSVGNGKTLGWGVAPARVGLQVVAHTGGKAQLRLKGGATFTAAMPDARVGARWSMAVMPDVAVLARGGAMDVAAPLILNGHVEVCGGDAVRLRLDDAQETVDWPVSALDDCGFGPLRPGDAVSLVLVTIYLRPEPGQGFDSASIVLDSAPIERSSAD